VAFLAAVWKAAKVLVPLAGALMAPTIPGHDVNIMDWDRSKKNYRRNNGEWAKAACRRTKEL
jgi:hypothetical protein